MTDNERGSARCTLFYRIIEFVEGALQDNVQDLVRKLRLLNRLMRRMQGFLVQSKSNRAVCGLVNELHYGRDGIGEIEVDV